MQQPVAYEFHQPVRIYALTVLRKKMRVLLDERDDVVLFLPGWLGTTFSLLRYDEFVTPDTLPVAVQTDIRGITQAVPPVLTVASVYQYVSNVESLQKIIVCQFLVIHCLVLYKVTQGYRRKRAWRSCSGSSSLTGSS